MKRTGWIKLHRSFLDWEHYSDANAKIVFIHLLLTASYEDTTFKGIEIKRGQVLISQRKLSNKLGISHDAVRHTIKKLQKSKEIIFSGQAGNFGQLFSIVNFDKYQDPQPKEQPEKIPTPNTTPNTTPDTTPNTTPNTTGEKVVNNETSDIYNDTTALNTTPNTTPNTMPNTMPNTTLRTTQLKNNNNINNNNNFKNNDIGAAASSDSDESEASGNFKNLSEPPTIETKKEKKRKVAPKEKKRSLLAKAKRKPTTPENRYYNAAVFFWEKLKPIYGDNYMFRMATVEKWEKDLRILEKSRGYKLEEVFDLLIWVIKNDDSSLTYIQSPNYFLKNQSKNLAMLRKKREFWEKDIRRRNGEIVTKISMPKNLIVADDIIIPKR